MAPRSSSKKNFDWVGYDEPHATRRRLILNAHPEIKQLYGSDPWIGVMCTTLVVAQTMAAWVMRDASWTAQIVMAFFFGGVCNHACSLAMHEISHNLASDTPWVNRVLSIFVNFPLAVPSAITFRKYHLEHHYYQGVDGIDVDIPSTLEGSLITTTFAKLMFVLTQIAFYALRPLCVKPKKPTAWEAANWAAVLSFNYFIYSQFGPGALSYLLLSSLLGQGIHPVAGHFIAEHYVFIKGFETYSYYGPLNYLTFHVGYHNEHHDFPMIPGSRLHKVRAMAPEFYQNLPQHQSWSKTLYDYITDPNVGPFSRVKRLPSTSVTLNAIGKKKRA